MAENEGSATLLDSLASDKGANKPGSPPEPKEEVEAELKRKFSELEKKHEATLSRIAELEKLKEEGEITPEEEEEFSDLDEQAEAIADKLRGMKEVRPWEKMWGEDSMKNAVEAVFNNEIMRANDFVEDMAIQEGYLKEGVSLDDAIESFARDIAPFTKPYASKRPERRNQLAYRDWKKDKERLTKLYEREGKIKEREDEEQRFRETGTRVARDKSIEDKFNSAKTGKEKAGLIADLIPTHKGAQE